MVTVSRTNGISIKGIQRLDKISKWATTSLEEYIDSPRAMRPFIRTGFARSIGIDGTWRGVKGNKGDLDWQPLSDFTNEKRLNRGYPAKQPILVQSGQLKAAGLTPFDKWGPNTKRSTRSFNAPYGNHNNIKMSATNQGRRFHAQISGARVANQYGGKVKGEPRGYYTITGKRMWLPQRAFWFLQQEDMDNAAVEFGRDLVVQWGKAAASMGLT